MFTIILAYINAKYDYGYEGLFIITFFIDLMLVDCLREFAN